MTMTDDGAVERYRQLGQEAHDVAMMYRGKLEVAEQRIAELEEREQALASLLLQYRDAHIDLTNAEVCDDGWNRLLTPMMLSRLDAIASHSPGFSLARREEESMRKGFWWGFERARMHPGENNILAQWEDVKALKRRNESVHQERAKQ